MKIMYLALVGNSYKVLPIPVEELENGYFRLVKDFQFCETEAEAWEFIKVHAEFLYNNSKYETDNRRIELDKIEEILKKFPNRIDNEQK